LLDFSSLITLTLNKHLNTSLNICNGERTQKLID
jgi:hypothetical protein